MCNFVSRKEFVEIRQTFGLKKKRLLSGILMNSKVLQKKQTRNGSSLVPHSIRAVNKAGSRYKSNLFHISLHSA